MGKHDVRSELYNEESFTHLANAIIEQAVRDYREARRTLKRYVRYPGLEEDAKRDRKKKAMLSRIMEAERMIDDCEKFFLSEWMMHLTDVSGEYILRKLREEKI